MQEKKSWSREEEDDNDVEDDAKWERKCCRGGRGQ